MSQKTLEVCTSQNGCFLTNSAFLTGLLELEDHFKFKSRETVFPKAVFPEAVLPKAVFPEAVFPEAVLDSCTRLEPDMLSNSSCKC